eukprot:CAMPEP_0119070262 /NCGR_PEP_ID=MMETSP1178-20130426/37894_1 /TAXON_ID=33656 /ORGANISM="unid sp, Strain CCMP2000" /LENGTH=127 /DNA_ID=CAMNT_0007052081 /DNA_START=134 /DNA_END=517 /DNA_ORIENTATION=+
MKAEHNGRSDSRKGTKSLGQGRSAVPDSGSRIAFSRLAAEAREADRKGLAQHVVPLADLWPRERGAAHRRRGRVDLACVATLGRHGRFKHPDLDDALAARRECELDALGTCCILQPTNEAGRARAVA